MKSILSSLLLISFLMGLTSVSGAQTRPPVQKITNIHNAYFTTTRCYENARIILRELAKRGVELNSDVKVLFISFFYHPISHGTYSFHVIVQQNDMIWDGNFYDNNMIIRPIPFKEYFRFEPKHEITELRVIPALDYLNDNLNYGFYWVGLKGADKSLNYQIREKEKLEVQANYPAISLTDYLSLQDMLDQEY